MGATASSTITDTASNATCWLWKQVHPVCSQMPEQWKGREMHSINGTSSTPVHMRNAKRRACITCSRQQKHLESRYKLGRAWIRLLLEI